MTKNDDRRLAEELDKHTAGQQADLPADLKTVSDGLHQAMHHTQPRAGFVNELAGKLQEQQQEMAEQRPTAVPLLWAKRLLAGAVGTAALIAFALFVSSLFSSPPVGPLVPDRRTATPPAVNATATRPPGSPQPVPVGGDALSLPDSCIPPSNRAVDRQLYVNITAGYCFQYPTSFHVGDVLPAGAPNAPDNLVLYGPADDPSLESLRAAVDVVAGPAEGRTLQEVVDQEIRSAGSGDIVTTQQATLGGEPAVILSGLTTCRRLCVRLFAVHDNHIYRLTLLGGKQVLADANLVWRTVLDTFAFLTPDQLAQFSACPTAASPYVSLTGGYCLSYPSDFNLRQLPGTVLLNASVPPPPGQQSPPIPGSLTIERSNVAEDTTLQTIADDLAAAAPDADIEPNVTLGPAPALVVHNPSGLLGGRRLFALHDGALYRLTQSSPGDSPDAVDAADRVWQAVIDSFTFLPATLPTPATNATVEPLPPVAPTPTPPSASDFPHHQNAILVAPTDDLPVPQSEFTRLGIGVVPTFDDLQARIESEPIEIIYLHPAVFGSLSPDDLGSLYEQGLLVVILNVPASEINAKFPEFDDYDDLAPQYFDSDEQFVAAAFHTYTSASESGSWTVRNFYPVNSFWYLVHDIERHWQETFTPGTVTPTPPPVPFVTPTPFSGDPQPGPSATPTAPPTQTGQATACTAVPRPALIFGAEIELDRVYVTVLDPLSRAQCLLMTEAYATGTLAASGDTLYYPRRDGDAGTMTVWRHALDGDPTPLSFTSTPAVSAPWFSLALSPDGQQLVWATFNEQSGDAGDSQSRSAVWLGDLQDGTVTQLWQEDSPAAFPATIEPLYVSPQENVLYFARRPFDIGTTGPLPAQYNALYTLSLDGGEPQPIFRCRDEFGFCLHDVDFERRLLTTVTGASEQPELSILDFDGALIASYAPPEDNYISQPIIGPNGDVAFITADLQETEQGTFVYRPSAIHLLAAPYTGQPQELLTTTGTYFELWRWFDGENLLATNLAGRQELTLLTLDGDLIPIPESGAANPLAVLQE